MNPVLVSAIVWFEIAVLVYFLVVNLSQAVLIGNAARQMRRNRRETWLEPRRRLVGSPLAPSIGILAPAYNEAATVVSSARSLLTIDYPDLEVIVVNDGSSDRTLDVLHEAFDLAAVPLIHDSAIDTAPVRGAWRSRTHPRLVVIDKENGGKADALNAGLEASTSDLVCAIDSDTLVEPDAMTRIVRPFLDHDDVVAAGGTIRVANDVTVHQGRVVVQRAARRLLARLQTVEYLRAFLFGRLGFNGMGGNLIVSGAFGLFRRDAVLAAGGYAHGTVGEDIELIATMRRQGIEQGGPNRVEFVPDPVAWTEVPESIRQLARQRDRWHRGLAETLWRHRRVIGRRRYGPLGTFVTPYHLVVELLAPVVELGGLIVLAVGLTVGTLDVTFAILFFLVAYGIGILLSLAALLLDEVSRGHRLRRRDRLRLFVAALLENVGYRQLTVFWRLRGLWRWMRGRSDWGVMERRGFADATT